jgi:hypothetical protein
LLAEATLLAGPLASRALAVRVLTLLDRGSTFVRVFLWSYFLLGGGVFVSRHLVALVQAMSNDALVKRLYSVSMQPPLMALSYIYVVALLATYAAILTRVTRNVLDVGPSEFFLLLLPVSVATALPLFVLSNSIRHYILVAMMLLVGIWVSCVRLGTLARWGVTLSLAAYGVLLNAFVWSILDSPRHYSSVVPLRFRFGHAVETSAHFLALDDTFGRMVTDGVEAVHTSEPFFIQKPLEFYRLSSHGLPVPGRVATIDYDYRSPGGIAYSLDGPKRSSAF